MEKITLFGYIIKDENKERFFKIVQELDQEIKDCSFFEECGFEFRYGRCLIRAGNNENGIDENNTFIGIDIVFEENLEEIKAELSIFEKFLDENEKNLKIIPCSIDVENIIDCNDKIATIINNDTTIYTKVEKILNGIGENYKILKAYTDGVEHYVFNISGGKNGNGNWLNYFSDIAQIFSILNYEFNEVWLIKIDNDVLDDIHYITFGIR